MAKPEFFRPAVYGKRGMVCSNSPLAAATGLRVLQDGGNAFDAALAVAAAETVTLVPLCGLGGDSFILLHEGVNGRVTGINSSGTAAKGATGQYYRNQGYSTMPLTGPHAVSVPGEVAAWQEVHQRFCTMPFPELIGPAIGYAQDGFPVSPGIAGDFARGVDKLAQFPSTVSVYLSNGIPPNRGDTLVNKDLADSLRTVAQGGHDAFYRGELTRSMVEGLNAGGGLFKQDDFAAYQAEVYDPIATSYRDHTIYQTRPPSQGFLVSEMLNLVEGFELSALGQNSPGLFII